MPGTFSFWCTSVIVDSKAFRSLAESLMKQKDHQWPSPLHCVQKPYKNTSLSPWPHKYRKTSGLAIRSKKRASPLPGQRGSLDTSTCPRHTDLTPAFAISKQDLHGRHRKTFRTQNVYCIFTQSECFSKLATDAAAPSLACLYTIEQKLAKT